MWSLLKQLAWSAQAEAAVMDLLFLHRAWNVFCRVFILIPHLFSKEACRTDAILGQPVLPLPWAVLCIPTRGCGASPGCRLSSGPWGISPAPPSAPPLAGRGATLPGSVVVPCAFFCITHDPKRSKFFSSLHTSSYQVVSELMLPSLGGMDFFGGWDFSPVYSDRVGNKINVSWERQSWIWLENTELKQWLPRMKGFHTGVELGNPERSIRGLDKAQRMKSKSFIDHSGRKTQL